MNLNGYISAVYLYCLMNTLVLCPFLGEIHVDFQVYNVNTSNDNSSSMQF